MLKPVVLPESERPLCCRPSVSADSCAEASPYQRPLCLRVLCWSSSVQRPLCWPSAVRWRVLLNARRPSKPLPNITLQHDAANRICEIFHLIVLVVLSTAASAARLSVIVGPPSSRRAAGEQKSGASVQI